MIFHSAQCSRALIGAARTTWPSSRAKRKVGRPGTKAKTRSQDTQRNEMHNSFQLLPSFFLSSGASFQYTASLVILRVSVFQKMIPPIILIMYARKMTRADLVSGSLRNARNRVKNGKNKTTAERWDEPEKQTPEGRSKRCIMIIIIDKPKRQEQTLYPGR